LSTDRVESAVPDASAVDTLEAALSSLLREQADDLSVRWTLQVRSVLLPDRVDDQGPERAVEARALVDVLIGDSGVDEGVSEDAIGLGLRFGSSAFARGVSLHHVIKGLELLTGMTLYVMESAVGRVEIARATAADGICLSRRLQSRAGVLSLAATQGYMQAYTETLREGFRHLRHDLRNPLGTIKSVLALMDDESVPLEARANPSFRAMATRNARSLEELIADRLSDAAALLPVIAGQDVPVRAIACAARRALRGEAERRGVQIQVEQGGAHGRLDAAGLELLLRGVLHAALQERESGERLRIEFEQPAGRANVVISCESGRAPILDEGVTDRLGTLARQIGATITASERVTVSMPLRVSDGGHPSDERRHSLRHEPDGSRDGQPRHDVRSAGEGHHGQASAH
jgi:signal transduction histidine kinase